MEILLAILSILFWAVIVYLSIGLLLVSFVFYSDIRAGAKLSVKDILDTLFGIIFWCPVLAWYFCEPPEEVED